MKFEIVWQSKYNGVSVDPIGFDAIEASEEECRTLDALDEEVSDTLPSYTYEVASRWDNLGAKEIAELKRRALAIINKYYPDVTIDDLTYSEDSFST